MSESGDDFVILMVEDDEEDRYTIERACKSCPVPVTLVSTLDAYELRAYLERRDPYRDTDAFPEPDILFLDINLPKVSGHEILQELRTGTTHSLLPVIMFSTSDNPDDARQCYRNGANAFITKPATYADTKAIIEATVLFWTLRGNIRMRK